MLKFVNKDNFWEQCMNNAIDKPSHIQLQLRNSMLVSLGRVKSQDCVAGLQCLRADQFLSGTW